MAKGSRGIPSRRPRIDIEWSRIEPPTWTQSDRPALSIHIPVCLYLRSPRPGCSEQRLPSFHPNSTWTEKTAQPAYCRIRENAMILILHYWSYSTTMFILGPSTGHRAFTRTTTLTTTRQLLLMLVAWQRTELRNYSEDVYHSTVSGQAACRTPKSTRKRKRKRKRKRQLLDNKINTINTKQYLISCAYRHNTKQLLSKFPGIYCRARSLSLAWHAHLHHSTPAEWVNALDNFIPLTVITRNQHKLWQQWIQVKDEFLFFSMISIATRRLI